MAHFCVTRYSDNEDVLQWTCLVASNIARDDVLTKELHKNRVCEALVNILAKHYKNCDLMEEALNVIAVIAGASVDARSTFIDQTICEFLVKILFECENEETTVEQTLLAFSSVLSIHTDCIDLAQNEPLLCAHSFHSDERAVQQLALARKYKAFLDDFLNAGGVKTLCRVISKYSAGSQFIAHYGSQCLCGLSMAALLAIDRSDVTASDRVLSVLRVGLIQGNSAQRSLLTLLGDCGGITILTQILGSYYQHKSIAKWSLLAILQLLTIEKNLELLKQTEICLFLSKLLEFYTFSAQEKDDNIFILSYEIIVQLCLFVECRNALGNYFVSFSSTHLLLTSLAHNLHSVEILRAGAEALSALCISPLEDALATIYKQQEHTEKRKSIKARSSLSAATNLLTGSASIAADGSAEGDTGALDWMKFESPQKAGAADVPSTDPEEQKDSKSSGFFSSFSFFRSRADTNPQAAESGPSQQSTDDRKRAVTMSTLDSYNNLPTSKANNRFVEAASSLVSSGMSDQEEMLIAQRRQQNVIRKTSAEVLVESGIVALLVSAIQAHPTHEGVLCAALNTLNTMAVNPLNREKFDDPLIFEVLVESLKAFLDIPSEGIAEDVGGDNDHEGGNSSSKRMSVRTITTSLEARRAVRILLLIVIGTVCMPVTDEESFQKSKGLQKKNTAAANIAAHHSALKIHEQNQENFAALNVFVLFLELLQTYSSDSLMSEALLRAIYYSINGNLVNQNRFADLKLIHSTDTAHMKPKEPAPAPPSLLTRLDSEDEHRRVTETDVPAKKEVLVSDSILLLVEILRQNVDKPRVIYYAGLAISAISNNHRDNSFQFGLLNICELVIQILTTFIENHVEIIQSCCQVIFNLKSLNHLWGQYNTCELILMALTIHPNNPVVAEWVCRVIGTLAENDHNKMELEKHSVCKVIVGAIQKHVSTDSLLSLSLSSFMKDNSSEGVARWGCTAIYFLAKGYQADLFQESLVSAGACEAVAKTLVKYSEDETIAYCSCRALVVLLMNNETYKSKLGSLGVCGCIVESLHLFPSSAQVAKWGCRAVAVLAENNEPNVGKLAIAGACETIPLVIQSHPTNEHVAQAGCDVISFMSEQIGNGFAARFGHAGACEAVVSVLRKHPNNNQVVARCSIALGSLARVPGNARWFGPAGAPDALYNVLVLHRKDVLVAKYIISAIGNLCLVDHNKERLGGLGVCEEIIFAANLHSKDLETAIASAAAIWKLCETIHKHAPKGTQAGNSLPTKDVRDGSSDEQQAASSDRSLPLPLAVDPEVSDNNLMNDPEKALRLKQSPHFLQGRRNRAILLQMNVCQTLVVLLNFHLADIVAAETICHAVSVLAAVGNACDEERNAFGDLGTCEAVVKALSFHEGNEEVARWGSMAVRSLCHKHPTNQLRFARTQIAKVLVLSLRGFRSAVTAVANHQMLMEAVLGAVVNLSNNCPENKVLFGETGLCEALLELLDLHIKNFEIVYLAVKALFHLCDGNQYNRMKISFSGAADFLMTCLTRFPDEDKLVDFILAIMIGMCFDKVGQSKLGGVGMPKHIFVLLNRYEKLSSEYLTLLCVVFMGILANGSKDNKEKLGAQNPQKVLIPILQKYLQANLVSSSSAGLSQQLPNGGAAGNFLSSTLNTIRRGSIMLSSLQAGAGAGGLSAQNSPMAVSSSAAPFSEEVPSPLPAQIPDEAHLLNNNNANADQTLASYIGEFSILKECCRTVYFLCYESEANRLKFQQVSVTVEILTTIMSSTYRPASSPGQDLARESSQEAYTEEIRSWAKKAMDVLEGSV